MKPSLLFVGVAATLMIAWFIGRVQGQQEQGKGKEKVIFVSADQANFHETVKGVSMAALWGTPMKERTPHSPSSCRDSTPGCTPTRTMFG
jgi:hypothetical protein